MPASVIPSPEPPTLTLATMLPVLRETLEEQRGFRLDQLANLARNANFGQRRNGGPAGSGGDARGAVAAALAVGATVALYDIETALARMSTGGYGQCLRCSRRIPPAWLAVIPQTRLCGTCRDRSPARGRTGAPPVN